LYASFWQFVLPLCWRVVTWVPWLAFAARVFDSDTSRLVIWSTSGFGDSQKGTWKEETKMKENVSRRDFLKGSLVVGAAGASAVLLSACQQEEVSASPVIEDPASITWDKEVDVLVAGSGAAGMSAAVTASATGVSTTVVDCNEEIGGSCMIMQGSVMFHGPNPYFEEQGYVPSKTELFNLLTNPDDRYLRRNNPDLVQAYLDCYEDAYDWMTENGIIFYGGRVSATNPVSSSLVIAADQQEPGPGVFFQLLPDAGDSSGSGAIRPLARAARANGAEILQKHKLVGLVKDDSGRVIGAKIDASGETLYFKANKGVILGTGAWKGARYIRKLYDPRFTEDIVGSAEPYAMCDDSAFLAALEVGGILASDYANDQHIYHRMFGTPFYRFPPGSPWAAPGYYIVPALMNEVICVDKYGKRFVDETLGEDGEGFYNRALKTEDHIIWGIWDSTAAAKNGWEDIEPPTIHEGMAFKADTIEELAAVIGVPADALSKTVADFNSYVDAGEDLEWERKPESLTAKIETPPFYGLWVSLQIHDPAGGLAIDANCNCLDIYGKVIPGLYATGETAGGLALFSSPKSFIQGRIAGGHAAKQ
jgi:succinate dehydrogenase/fumarate reductase flavoprotein subunit